VYNNWAHALAYNNRAHMYRWDNSIILHKTCVVKLFDFARKITRDIGKLSLCEIKTVTILISNVTENILNQRSVK